MMSAPECIEKAKRCEEMARATARNAERCMLLATALQWRGLARIAENESAYGRLTVSDDQA